MGDPDHFFDLGPIAARNRDLEFNRKLEEPAFLLVNADMGSHRRFA
jgi:hypothetical protein